MGEPIPRGVVDAMLVESALSVMNELLGIDGVVTHKGDELKCRTFDSYDASPIKTYFDAENCRALATAFGLLADALSVPPDQNARATESESADEGERNKGGAT